MNKIIEEDLLNILSDNNIEWSKFKDSTFLITGANGMLPAYLVFTLLKLNEIYNYNIHVIALVRNEKKAKEKFKDHLNNSHLEFLVQDVSEPIHLKVKVDYIIHAASQASPKYYGIDPVGTINANVLGTINTLKIAYEKQVKSYLYFSTGDVYGIVPPELFPFTEKDYGYIDLLNVRSCYAESKRLGENLCVAWNYQLKVPTKIVRIFHTYGPGMDLNDQRVFADFCKNIINGEDITLRSDGKATRLFCYISDAIKAYFKILLDGENANAYNVANPNGEISIYNLAKLLTSIYPEKRLKLKLEIIPDDLTTVKMKSPLQRAIPDCSKIIKLGWNPSITIQEGFKRTIDSFIYE